MKTSFARLTALISIVSLAACQGGSGSGSPLPRVSPPGGGGGGGGGTTAASLFCTAAGAPQSIVRKASFARNAFYHPVNRIPGASAFVPGVIEAVYDRSSLPALRPHVDALLARAAAAVSREIDVPSRGQVVQVLHVSPGREESAIAQLRASGLVRAAARARYAHALSTTASLTNDPIYDGISPANIPPLYELPSTEGQWDNHVICAANAWGYGKTNTTGKTFAGALGGSVPIAIVDTGADLTHPDLSGRFIYGETVLDGVVTPGLAAMHDNDGHGTDVSGIAAATGNNGFGFAGVAYHAPLMIFKVFKDPPAGGCPPKTTLPACLANVTDIARAIDDAVAHGARVINLSLGATPPEDPAEGAAVANAIAHNVVVVAASGNEAATALDVPAADPGVIAVGASSLLDSTSAIGEAVASYSNYDNSNATWGLVAPGGDPSGNTDADDLHWIENLWTHTAADGSSAQACTTDPSGKTDCRVFIAGTSQATPHVAGAAALLLSVGASASTIKQLLCSTAGNLNTIRAGCGRLNVYRAMAAAVRDPSP